MGIEVLFHSVTIERLLVGFSVTLKIALIAILISWFFGTLFGVIRTTRSVLIRGIFRVYLESIRIIPLLVWLFILYFILPADFDMNLSAQTVAIIVFSLWGAGEMSDIVRGALISLPKHQTESALAVGLNKWQVFGYVLLPQAFKRTIPAAINLSARMIMTTSLLVFVGVIEVVKVGQQIIEYEKFTNEMAPFWIYGFILILYFMVCYPLSKFARMATKQP
ncbi:amino acid ABC transporter permease [Neisseria sp. Ec49-e6-T10]|uniref:amino acid ABC transporter permease n=1 Tax=Neisseria sp. Ec49-e6-T10 TaxID=3140744 RepID=UPI003EB77C33